MSKATYKQQHDKGEIEGDKWMDLLQMGRNLGEQEERKASYILLCPVQDPNDLRERKHCMS